MTAKSEIPQLIQEFIYARDHRLLENDVGRAVTRLMQHGVVDDLVCSLIHNPVRKHKIAQAFTGPFELPRLSHGDLVQGIDQHGRPIRFRSQYLNGHSLTIGGTGSGKTTKSRFLILQIAPKVRGLWCFDFVKREFAVLKPYLARLDINLLIVPARELRLNPLQCPSHVTPTLWAPWVADMLVQTLRLPPRATKLLHTTILEAYDRFGIFSDGERHPTLFDLREAVAANAQANHPARQAILDSIDPVLMSIGDVLKYRIGWKTRDLAKRHIVFELGGIAEVDKNLILNSLVLPEFVSRVAQGISNPRMDLWICCDDAARLVSPTSQSGGIADLIALVRGTGIGLDLSAQSADVVHSVVSNTANKFIARSGSATDYDTISASMGLTREQRLWLNTNLRPGLFVGQIGEGGWRQPFVFQIPKMYLREFAHLSAAEQIESDDGLKDLLDLPTVVADEFANWRSTATNASSSATARTGTRKTLSDAEIRYIQAVVGNPGTPSSELPKLAQISSKRAQKIRSRLVELEYLRQHRVTTGKRGRAAVVLEPLEPALRAIRVRTPEATT